MSAWTKVLASSNGEFTLDDLERAACRLDAQQVIFEADHGCRLPYALITRHLGVFRDVFEPFGKEVLHRPHHGYVICMARQRIGPKMPLAQTRLAIVLFRVYNDKMQRADIDNGAIVVETIELQQAWETYLGLGWSFRAGEIEGHLKALKRYGILQIRDTGDTSNAIIVIRPAIEDVLGETILHQMAAYAAGGEYASDDEGDNNEAA